MTELDFLLSDNIKTLSKHVCPVSLDLTTIYRKE